MSTGLETSVKPENTKMYCPCCGTQLHLTTPAVVCMPLDSSGRIEQSALVVGVTGEETHLECFECGATSNDVGSTSENMKELRKLVSNNIIVGMNAKIVTDERIKK